MNRRVMLIAAGACLAIVGGWYMLLWSPGQSSMKAAGEREAAAEQKEQETAAKVRALDAAKKNLPAIQAQVDVLRKAVPDTAQLDTVIATIDAAAGQSGIDLRALAPTPLPAAAAPAAGTVPPPFTELRFTMSANGSYAQLQDFVKRLSATPRLIVVDSVSLAGQGKDGLQTAGISGRMFTTSKASAAPTTPTTVAAGAK